ncbi:hypothetical protein CLV51_101260 [Chitinophaga niastensis]|uniref:Uncharacterized protein n=1 Tax=Chitinophaga niastensis TaxID=536980 RepID=A0A2P8HRS7_CHINA|nr:hypothetical protein CLV51_101260 [Chitinophaga niastensis]
METLPELITIAENIAPIPISAVAYTYSDCNFSLPPHV